MSATTRTPERPGSSSNRGLHLTLIAVAVVVAALFVVALVVGGGDDGTDVTSSGLETAPVEVEGAPLPVFPADAAGVADPTSDPAVGEAVPRLSGVSFDGTPVAITPDGTPRLVLFVAHWCPHCQREVPKVQDLVEGGRVPDGVQIVAVSTAVRPDQGNHPPSAWLADEGWTSPVLVDDDASSAARAYGLTGFPYGVYLDGDGRVVARTSGEVEADVVEDLLGQLSE